MQLTQFIHTLNESLTKKQKELKKKLLPKLKDIGRFESLPENYKNILIKALVKEGFDDIRGFIMPGVVTNIVDFLHSRPNVTHQTSYDELLDKSDEWHEKLKQKEVKSKAAELDPSQVVYKFNNGYKIYQLKSKAECKYEGEYVGHCVGDYGDDVENETTTLFSLRSPQDKPISTIEIDPRRRRVLQIYGNGPKTGNVKPDSSNSKLIIKWLDSRGYDLIDYVKKVNAAKNKLISHIRDKYPEAIGINPDKYGDIQVNFEDNVKLLLNEHGRVEWYKNDELHREDGPAITNQNGYKAWYKHGELHREDGPAVIDASGLKHWYKDGKRYRKDGPAVVGTDGLKSWYKNGKPHRENGPALIKPDGEKRWYRNGEAHREDGPAIISSNGTKYWYQNGVLHREDGPAVEFPDGGKAWYINGKLIKEKNV